MKYEVKIYIVEMQYKASGYASDLRSGVSGLNLSQGRSIICSFLRKISPNIAKVP